MAPKKKIVAIVTEYRPGSHADVVLTKFLKGFPTDEGFFEPRVELAGLYLDQVPANDIGYALAEEHGVTIYDTIAQALTLGGNTYGNDPVESGTSGAVRPISSPPPPPPGPPPRTAAQDGVLLIGEHGDYGWNEKDQHLYPRKYFMEAITGWMSTAGKPVPVFCDKHLSCTHS